MIEMAQRLGRLLQQDKETALYVENMEEEILAELQTICQTMAETDESVATFLHHLQEEISEKVAIENEPKRPKRPWFFRPRIDPDQILQEAQTAELDSSVNKYRRAEMTAEDIAYLYDALLHASDPTVIFRLAKILGERELPFIDPILFDWLEHEDSAVRFYIKRLLQDVKNNQAVREAGIQLLQQSRSLEGMATGIHLLRHYYQSADAELIYTLCQKLRLYEFEDYYVHQYCQAILTVAEAVQDHHLIPALQWIYENNPCIHCREKTVKLLQEVGGLSPDILDECQHDCHPNIREIGRAV